MEGNFAVYAEECSERAEKITKQERKLIDKRMHPS